jgi:hypothetical protein
VQAEGHVHIFEIGAKFFGEGANVQKCLATIKGARSADAEDFTALEIALTEWLTVAPLSGNAAQEIAVSGAVD